jgi:hypothetical protein
LICPRYIFQFQRTDSGAENYRVPWRQAHYQFSKCRHPLSLLSKLVIYLMLTLFAINAYCDIYFGTVSYTS